MFFVDNYFIIISIKINSKVQKVKIKNRDKKLGNKTKTKSLNKWKFKSGYVMANYRLKIENAKKRSKIHPLSRYTND